MWQQEGVDWEWVRMRGEKEWRLEGVGDDSAGIAMDVVGEWSVESMDTMEMKNGIESG